MRTISAKRSWFNWLQDHCLGSSGDGGSLIGMRRSFWGNDAYVIRCCGYLFRVTEGVFSYINNVNSLQD